MTGCHESDACSVGMGARKTIEKIEEVYWYYTYYPLSS